METIILKSITCHKPSETDKDEIFLKFQGEKLWPKKGKFERIDENQTIDLNLNLNAKTIWVELELWEYDYMSRNDFLGDFSFKSSNYAGEYTAELKVANEFAGKVEYSLRWELLR